MIHSLLLALCLFVQSQPSSNALTGQVRDAEGKPVAQATVFVYSARPRLGNWGYCPSSFADCMRGTITDKSGKFTIPVSDPELIFKVLVVAKGYQPKFVSADPLEDLRGVNLNPRPEKTTGQAVLRGRIVNVQGKPVVGAVVSPTGWKKDERRSWGTPKPGVDIASLTDDRGEFTLIGNGGDQAYDLVVESWGFPQTSVDVVPADGTIHEIVLTEGVTVSGRILQEGKSIAGMTVNLGECDPRGASLGFYTPGNAVKEFTMRRPLGIYRSVTDRDGRFTFKSVPLNDKFYLYTLMQDTKNHGAIWMEVATNGDDRREIKVGNLSPSPVHRIKGRVILTDGKPVPASTKIGLSLEDVPDGQLYLIEADGSFSFDNVPEEAIHLALQIPGYRLASNRNNLQQEESKGKVALFVDEDKQLEIFFEPEKPAPTRI